MSSTQHQQPGADPPDFSNNDWPKRLQDQEARLLTVTAERDAALREMDDLARFLSHDLRAPLRGIDGYSQALMEDYRDKLDPIGTAYLQFIFEASRQTAGLIEKLIFFIRVRSAEMHIQSIDLSQLASDLIQPLHSAQPDRKVSWVIASDLVAQGDQSMVRDLLLSLLENAWKFTSKNAAACIEVGRVQTTHGSAFFVRDDGAGFNMDYADQLFKPFQRLHSSHEFEGAGMGLAIARRIVERHQGRIWAEGKIDQGATFYFTLGG